MKKFIFAAALSLTTLSLNAQTTEKEDKDYLPDGTFTVEWRFNPFSYESKPVNVAQLNGRLFINETSAVRLGIGVGFNTDKDEQKQSINSQSVNANNYDIGNSLTTIKNTSLTLKVGAGYEYHFANTGRLDFYGGGEVGYLGRFYSATKTINATSTNVLIISGTTTKTQIADTESYDYSNSNADRDKFTEHGIFGTVFTGIDFYIYRKLYVGAELGLTVNAGTTSNASWTRNKTHRSVVGANETENWTESFSSETGITNYVDNLNNNNNRQSADYATDSSDSFIKVYVEPTIRIGWMF